MRRRDLFKATARTGGVLAAGGLSARAWGAEVLASRPRSNAARLAHRPYGKSGVPLSILGFPGFALKELDQRRVYRLVAEAVERGVNYFDVAPEYGDAEERLGPALEPYRKQVFLACKTAQRTAEGAAAELEASLAKLRTDHFDLHQLHHIKDVKRDVDVPFARGGAMEVLIRAKKEGRVRHLGFSAHSQEAAIAAMDRYDFDSVLFPVNYTCWHKGGWGPAIAAKARERGVTMLALKPLARQTWTQGAHKLRRYRRCWYQPITDLDEADLSLRWTLTQPVTAAIPPAAEFLFRPAVALAMDYTPIEPQEEQRLATLSENLNPLFRQV